MTLKNKEPEELNYFKLTLLNYLKESFPEHLNDEEFIVSRSDRAAKAYSEAVLQGYNQIGATELANVVLYEGLHFSKFDTLVEVLDREFTTLFESEEYEPFALKMLPLCEEAFARYTLSDDFSYEPEFDNLYTELTGIIQIYIEENGLH